MMDFENMTCSISQIDDKYVTEAVEYFNRRKPARILKKIQIELEFWKQMAVGFLTIFFLTAALGYPRPYYAVASVFTDAIMHVTPERESCENNGITFSVESVTAEHELATMYVSIQDTQGDRVNAATQLEGYCEIFTIRDQIVSCMLSEYDAMQHKATYQILIRHRNGKDIAGRKLILRMYQFMDGKEPVQGKWKVAVQV